MEDLNLFFEGSNFFAVTVTLLTYFLGTFLFKKTHFFLFNPLIVSTVLSIVIIKVLNVSYGSFEYNTKVINYLLTPATVCLAVPLYEQFDKLKSNALAIIGGILAGVLTNLVLILVLCLIFKIGHTEYVSMLPKSVTTAIGIAVSEELGGVVGITVVMIILTGNIGNLFAEQLCKLFRIKESIAKGVAIGNSSHVLGTAKAIEMGEVEGAMSSLAVAVAGLITVAGASIFAQFI